MGLFDTSSTAKSTSTQRVNPTFSPWADAGLNEYFTKSYDFLKSDPQQWITPFNPIQQEALNNWTDYIPSLTGVYAGATSGAQGVAGQANSAAQRDAYDPTYAVNAKLLPTVNVNDIGSRGFATASTGTLGDAQRAGYTGYNAPQLGNASTWQGQGYNAALVGDASQYLNGDIERANAASLLDNFDSYMNPYLGDVVNSSLAEYDQSLGADRARRDALAAKNRAFGDSAYDIGSAAYDSDAQRQRASLAAGLRSDAFMNAAGLSNLDASRRQETGIFNAGEANNRDIQRANLALQSQGFNASAINDARAFAATARNQSERDAATAQNEFRLQQAGFDAESARFLADAANRSEADYAAALNQFAQTRYSEEGLTNRFNADAESAALADTYAAERSAAEQNAAAENTARQNFFNAQVDINQANADRANQAGQFNANYQQQARDQYLQALRDSTAFADQRLNYLTNRDSALMDIGNQLWNMQNAQNLAPLQQLQTYQNLLNPDFLNATSGKEIQGWDTTKQKSSDPFGTFLSIASLFS